MDRLRDQSGSDDPLVARAAELLSALPPIDAERVGRPPRLPPMQANRRGVAGLRFALVGALTLASVVAAAASARRAGFFGPPPESVETIAAPMVVPPAPPALRPAAVPAASVSTREPLRTETAGPSVVSPRRTTEAAREPGLSPGAGESILMVQAVRALRHDGDPTRAQTLAEEVLRRYPHGSQVEEAMVLSMEASAVRGDAAGAQRAADRYLVRFPSGRFADRARHVLGGT